MGAVIVSIELLKDSIDDYLKLKKQLEGKLKEPFDSETFGWEIKNRLEELTKEIGDFSLKQEYISEINSLIVKIQEDITFSTLINELRKKLIT